MHTSVSYGLEGRQLREQIENISRHWQRRSSTNLVTVPADPLDQLSDYRHLPFERVGVRRVRYVGVTDLKPRRIEYEFNDEDVNG